MDFVKALEARVNVELGGSYDENKQWSQLLSHVPIGEDPREAELRYHTDGTGRGLGLLLFVERMYKQSVDYIGENRPFASIGELSDWLLGPFPWLGSSVRELAHAYQLEVIPQLSRAIADSEGYENPHLIVDRVDRETPI